MAVGKSWTIECADNSGGYVVVRVFLQEEYGNGYSIVKITGMSAKCSHRNGSITFNGTISINGQTVWSGSNGAHNTGYISMGGFGAEAWGTYPYSSSQISHTGAISVGVSLNINGNVGGSYYYTCSKSQNIELTATHSHSYSSAVTSPTCTSGGYTTYTCSCGDSYVDNYTIPLGHSWNSGVITTQPSYSSTGVKTYTCSNCAMKYTSKVSKLGAFDKLVKCSHVRSSGAFNPYTPYAKKSGSWVRLCYDVLGTVSSGGGTTTPTTYAVDYTLTGVTNNNSVTTVNEGNSYTINLSLQSGYKWSNVIIIMGSTQLVNTTPTNSNYTYTISNVTGNIGVMARASAQTSSTTFTVNAPNTTINSPMETAVAGATRVWTANTGYNIVSFTLNVNGTEYYATIDDNGSTSYSSAIRGRVVINNQKVTWMNIQASELQGNITITIVTKSTAASGGSNTYSVATESGAAYGFTLTDGWYVRDNGGVHSSCAMSRITFNMSSAATVRFTVVNYAEISLDYGVLSTIDNTLTSAIDNSSHQTDVSNGKVQFNGYPSNYVSSGEQTVTYNMPAGQHFIIAKYKKDSSGNANGDMFKFKVEIL